jgi:ribosome maturation factor RimP/glutaredoxin
MSSLIHIHRDSGSSMRLSLITPLLVAEPLARLTPHPQALLATLAAPRTRTCNCVLLDNSPLHLADDAHQNDPSFLAHIIEEGLGCGGLPRQRRRRASRDRSREKPGAPAKKSSVDPAKLLATGRAAIEQAAVAIGVELVGVVFERLPRGSDPGAFKCWIDSECGVDGRLLGDASRHLRDALWSVVPGRPGISCSSPGRTRPLFSESDFERFRGMRVQIALLEPTVDGRRRLVGELLGLGTLPDSGDGEAEGEEPCVLVHDETAGAPVSAPLALVQLGDRSTLLPLNAKSGPLALAKPSGGKTDSLEASAFIEEQLNSAPVAVFVKRCCPHSRRLLKVLRDEVGLEPGDERLHVVSLEGRTDMVVLQQHLRMRTGVSTAPHCFFANGWVGGVSELEALVEAGPGRVAARLMEAVSEHDRRTMLEEERSRWVSEGLLVED